jgi:hypothetical protein
MDEEYDYSRSEEEFKNLQQMGGVGYIGHGRKNTHGN